MICPPFLARKGVRGMVERAFQHAARSAGPAAPHADSGSGDGRSQDHGQRPGTPASPKITSATPTLSPYLNKAPPFFRTTFDPSAKRYSCSALLYKTRLEPDTSGATPPGAFGFRAFAQNGCGLDKLTTNGERPSVRPEPVEGPTYVNNRKTLPPHGFGCIRQWRVQD